MTMPITDKPPTTNASLVSVDSPELSLPARRDGSVSSLTISGAGGAVLGVVVLTVDSVVVGAVVEGVERGGLVVDRGADVVLGARVVDGAAVVVVSTELVVLLSVVGVDGSGPPPWARAGVTNTRRNRPAAIANNTPARIRMSVRSVVTRISAQPAGVLPGSSPRRERRPTLSLRSRQSASV